MRVFSAEGLEGREFSDRLLRVTDLKTWVAQQGIGMPLSPELQGLEGYDFVNVAALLGDIGNALLAQTSEAEREARAIVAAHPHLAADPAAESAPRWLAADHARKEWRAAILAAEKDGALVFLDPASKLPFRAAVERLAPQPIQKQAAQEDAILNAIKRQGLDPQSLPRIESGRAGHKSAIRDVFFHPSIYGAERKPKLPKVFPTERTFEKAWERLRAQGEIADVRPTP